MQCQRTELPVMKREKEMRKRMRRRRRGEEVKPIQHLQMCLQNGQMILRCA